MGRKVFLNDLPRRGKLIHWIKCAELKCKVRFIYKDVEGYVEIVGYDPKEQYLFIVYQDKEPFKIATGSFQNCNLGKLLGKYTNEFKIEIGVTFKDDKRDLIVIDRDCKKCKDGFIRKYYKYRCNKCGFECGEHYRNGEYKEEFWTEEAGLLSGAGCSCCDNKAIITHINSIVAKEETHWMIPYFQGGYDEAKKYSKSSGQKIYPICPDCKRIKDKKVFISNLFKTHSIGCSCGDGFSYGHKYVHNVLTQLKMDFIDNHKFDWCKFYNPFKEKETTGEYDFVIENMKLIVEVDGGWHREDNPMSGQTKEESDFIDNTKDKLADKYGYKIIRVVHNDDLNMKENIIKSKLIHIYDLTHINWNQCESFALSNRVLEACKLKKNNPDITTLDIGIIINVNRNIVVNYLKKGSKLGWCEYDPKEEMRKTGKRNGARLKESKSKRVEIFKDNISLGIFESCTELDRQSEELFGVKLNFRNISAVCLGKIKTYKGFTFKY